MEIRKKVQDIIRDVTDNESIELYDEMTDNDIEDYDSMSHIDTLLRIENEMDIKFTPEEIVSSKDIGTLIRIIEEKL